MRCLRWLVRSPLLKVALVVALPVLAGCGGGGGTGAGTGDHITDPTCTSAFAPRLQITNSDPLLTLSSTAIFLDGVFFMFGPILVQPGQMREITSMAFIGHFLSVSATYSDGSTATVDFVTQLQCNDLKQAFFQ